MALKQGDKIGKLGEYTIQAQIGQGGMGSVYLASFGNQTFAVKEISKGSLDDKHWQAMLLEAKREANRLCTMQHSGIPRCLDTSETATSFYIIMDYIEGIDLDVYITNNHPLSEVRILEITLAILDILEYVHNLPGKMIFRDMKPKNVMIDKNDKIWLIDFGISRELQRQTGATQMGTEEYSAWEQASPKHKADGRADLYALAWTMYHMARGDIDLGTPSFNQPDLRQFRSDHSTDFYQIWDKAKELELDKRYQTAADFKADVSVLLQKLIGAVPKPIGTIAPPIINGLSVNEGINIGTVDVIVTGKDFGLLANVYLGNGPTASRANVKSDQEIECRFDLTGVVAGNYQLIVMSPDGQWAGKNFKVKNPIPTISSVNPTEGLNGRAVSVTIIGSNFIGPVEIEVAGKKFGNIPTTSTAINATLDLTGLATGQYNLKVTNSDGQFATVPFQIKNPAPMIIAISPDSTEPRGALSVEIVGNNFLAPTVEFFSNSNQLTCRRRSFTSTKVEATLAITNASLPGKYTVKVTNQDGQSVELADAFEIKLPGAPAVTSITPNTFEDFSGVKKLLVNGDFFKDVDKVALCTTGATIKIQIRFTKLSTTQLEIELDSSVFTAGVYDLVLSTPFHNQPTIVSSAISVTPMPKPEILNFSPDYGMVSARVKFEIFGKGFRPGCQVFLQDARFKIPVLNLRIGPDKIIGETDLQLSPGVKQIKVVNPNGKDAVSTKSFTIRQPATVKGTVADLLAPHTTWEIPQNKKEAEKIRQQMNLLPPIAPPQPPPAPKKIGFGKFSITFPQKQVRQPINQRKVCEDEIRRLALDSELSNFKALSPCGMRLVSASAVRPGQMIAGGIVFFSNSQTLALGKPDPRLPKDWQDIYNFTKGIFPVTGFAFDSKDVYRLVIEINNKYWAVDFR